jgi:hypothetical protein
MKGFRAVGEGEFLLSVWSAQFQYRHCYLPISVKPPVGGFVVLGEPRGAAETEIETGTEMAPLAGLSDLAVGFYRLTAEH